MKMALENKLKNTFRNVVAGGLMGASAFSAYSGDFDHLPVEMTPEIQEQIDNQAVPEFLADTMFERLQPQAGYIIDKYNFAENNRSRTSVGMGAMRYWADPTHNKSHGMSAVPKFSDDVIDLPEYWAFIRAVEGRNSVSWRHIWRNKKEDIEDEGTYYFASGINGPRRGGFNPITVSEYHDWEVDRKEDLLRALYIGATGSDEKVDSIMDGSFKEDPRVIDKINEWKSEFEWNPFSNDENNRRIKLLAYLDETLPENPKDPHLAGLSLYALDNHSNEIMRLPKYENVFAIFMNSEHRKNNYPHYGIMEENTMSLPLIFSKK